MSVCTQVCVWEGEVFHITRCPLYVNLNEGAAQLVRISRGSIPSVSYVCFPQQYIAHLQMAPCRWCIHKAYQADVSMDFHTRLEKPPKGKFYASVSSIVSFLYLQKLTSESSFSKW